MTRNQRLSRALMYRLIGAAFVIASISNVIVGRHIVAGILMTIAMVCAFFVWFNTEEAKHL